MEKYKEISKPLFKNSYNSISFGKLDDQNELAISSILENPVNNEETDILEYWTPNYATNTSKLFSTKGDQNMTIFDNCEPDKSQNVQIYEYGI